VKIVLNGEERELDAGTTIARLIDDLGLGGKRVAAELNVVVVDSEDWASTVLTDGDRLELVRFVGGG
jgi:thiamine biosynthesis protein ThiS